MDTDYERVKRAIVYIANSVEQQPTLDDVADQVGLSPSHFQRLFVRWAGVSPKRFLQHLTASRAKKLLETSKPVLDVAFEVGLSGSGRLHDLLVATDAVTPGQLRDCGRGLAISYGTGSTPFGDCLIATTDRGICALQFYERDDLQDAVEGLASHWRNASLTRDRASALRLLASVFGTADAGVPPAQLHLKGTNFQLKVWQALLMIPPGSLISYSDLAQRIGEPTASRAVANAVGANPVAYVIPCHRVLRSTGELGGYRWGTDRKLVMIERELETTAPR